MKVNQTNFIEQLKLHNEDALAYVIDHYGALLMAVIRKHLYLFPQLQEECMNDVLLSIWQHIESYDSRKNSFRNWIAAIARFQAIDYIRKYKKDMQKISWNEINANDFGQEMFQEVVEDDFSIQLQELLNCLKPLDQEIFRRLYVDEKSVEQVSRELNIKTSAIYNRISRARKKLIHFRSVKGDA